MLALRHGSPRISQNLYNIGSRVTFAEVRKDRFATGRRSADDGGRDSHRSAGLRVARQQEETKRALVLVKEAMIIVGRELGASNADLAKLLGLDASVVSRRYESGRAKLIESQEVRLLKQLREELTGKK